MLTTLPSSPVMVGREPEMGRVLRALAAPQSVVAVYGEPGIGKSRLVRELSSALAVAGTDPIVGRCLPDQRLTEFAPVLDALAGLRKHHFTRPPQAVAGTLSNLLPELSDCLPAGLPALEDPSAHRHRLQRGIREVLSAAGRVLLILEDLHWGDPATVGLVSSLAANPIPSLSVLVTSRPEWDSTRRPPFAGPTLQASAPTVQRIDLAPLSSADTAALLRGMFGAPVATEFAESVHARAGGLPFAVEELGRYLHATGGVVRRSGRWRLGSGTADAVPQAVADAVGHRLAALPGSAVLLVTSASVLLGSACESELATLAGLPELECRTALRTAISAGMLTEAAPDRYVFRHPLTRNAVCGAVAGPDRRRLHLSAAKLLQARENPPHALVAEHYRQAGEEPRAVEATIRAAAEALGDGHTSAVLELVVSPLKSGRLSAAAAVELSALCGRAAMYEMNGEAAIPLLRDTIARTDLSPQQRGRLWIVLGWLLFCVSEGARDGALACFAQGADLLESCPELRGAALAAIATHSTNYTLEQRLTLLSQAAADADSSGSGALQLSVHGERMLLLVREARGEFWDELAEFDRVAPATPEELRQWARGMLNAAHVAIHLGHTPAVAGLVGKCDAVVSRLPGPWLGNPLRTLSLLVLWATGRWNGLAKQAAALLDDDTARDDPCLVEAEVVVALCELASGRSTDFVQRLEEIRDAAADAQEWGVYFLATSALLRARDQQDAEGACSALVHTTEHMATSRQIWHHAAEFLVTVADVGGLDADALAGIVARAASAVEGLDAPALRAAITHGRATVLAMRADAAAASNGFAAAAAAWREIDRPYWAAAADASAGRIIAHDDPTEARILLSGALDTYVLMGATRPANRVRRMMRDSAVAPPYRREGYGQRLSAREREVAALVIDGLTDRQIAATLFVSPRTVSKHVGNILAKAGATGRRDLSADVLELPRRRARLDNPG